MTLKRTKILMATGALLGVLIASLFALNTYHRWALREFRHELRAKGERLVVTEMLPSPIPLADNAAPGLIQAGMRISGRNLASAAVLSNVMRPTSPGRAQPLWRQERLRGRSTNSWEAVEAELRQVAREMEMIHAALQKPECYLNLNYTLGLELMVPHVSQQKADAQWLGVQTVHFLHGTNLEPALASLHDLMRLLQLCKDEPIILTQTVRMNSTQTAYGLTWEALQATGWDDATLAALQADWEALSFIEPMCRAMEMERAMGLIMFDKFRRTAQSFRMAASPGARPPGQPTDVMEYFDGMVRNTGRSLNSMLKEDFWRWHWSYQDELRYLKICQFELATARRAAVQKARARDPSAASIPEVEPIASAYDERRFQLSVAMQGNQISALNRALRAETQKQMAVAAIALKRHQLRRGNAASSLAALVPEFLAAIPIDCMDGHPLRYRETKNGEMTLYSIGENGRDDGGNPRPTKSNQDYRGLWDGLDYVWPLPSATGELPDIEFRRRGPPRE